DQLAQEMKGTTDDTPNFNHGDVKKTASSSGVESSISKDSSIMRSKRLEVRTSVLFALRHDV
ncbi:predicted protein, partial [Arabidopsis lyrata subsp. lyrata]